MTEQEESEIIKKVYDRLKKDDGKLEAYKNLATLYIKIDESVMTRHKFFLSIIIAIFTAIGLLIYQLNDFNLEATSFLIRKTSAIGIVICLAWLAISYRGLFILDKVISRQLEWVEKDLHKGNFNIYRAFTIFNDALTKNKEKKIRTR